MKLTQTGPPPPNVTKRDIVIQIDKGLNAADSNAKIAINKDNTVADKVIEIIIATIVAEELMMTEGTGYNQIRSISKIKDKLLAFNKLRVSIQT